MSQSEEEKVIEIPDAMALVVSQDTEKLLPPEFAEWRREAYSWL